jgi:hypothetical protein
VIHTRAGRPLLMALAAVIAAMALTGVAQARAGKSKTLTVCKHGCLYRTIQSAVDHSGKNATIKVKPGKYVEGVIVTGHKHDGLTIMGTGKTPGAVLLEGRNAKGPGGAAQNGVQGAGVDNLAIENMKAEHYPANGFFINNCHGFLMSRLVAKADRAYGLYVFKCIGGRMTHSVGYLHGDAAFYVGGTPPQKHPKTTLLDHDTGYKNVLGFSGSNAKYVDIRDSEFYDNGAGIVPNTWKPEPYEPTSDGVIEHNLIYWNNFDYFRPNSPVKTTNHGVNGQNDNFPIGAGVMLFGATGWKVRANSVFGNFLWGIAAFSDPTNDTGKAVSFDNTITHNKMGAAFRDANGSDFFNDGSGRGTCFQNNGNATYDTNPTASQAVLYPSCPTTAGTGTVNGNPTQVLKLAAVALANPPSSQEKYWHVHPHPARKNRKPYEG